MRLMLCAALAATLAAVPALAAGDAAPAAGGSDPAAGSAAGQPTVAALLFSGSQWKNAPAGSVITYDYGKKVANSSFGPSFDDHIVLTLDKGDAAGNRTVEVKMFSGGNAKPAGPFSDDEQNPVPLLVLEESVQEMSASFHANPRYIKNAIRKAWREHPTIAPVTLSIDGKDVQGTRITVEPFKGDPESDRMKGLETITYTIDVSDAVPGYIAAMDIHAPADGATTFSETLRYQGIKQP